MRELELLDLYKGFRNPKVIQAYAKLIHEDAKKLNRTLNIMEVCGGHTHSIMKYALPQLLPKNINFIHGPGCPVCILPRERIDDAYALAMQEGVILVTLGDMIKVPGSRGSLQDARARGADVRFVYSPLESLKIAQENPQKKIIFFAIGFETTTPMTAALLDAMLKQGIQNILFYINHVTIPEAMELLLCDEESKIDAFLGPSHVSVISGSKIYESFISKYKTPVVVAGFEPVDIMHSISMLIKQFLEQRCELEVEYGRAVNANGNAKAQALCERYFEKAQSSLWRGVGEIKKSGLKLKSEYDAYNAELIYTEQLQKEKSKQNEEHKLCICGDILKGKSKPKECKIFGTLCTPSHPIGSCMVSSEGACAAYYKYGNLL